MGKKKGGIRKGGDERIAELPCRRWRGEGRGRAYC